MERGNKVAVCCYFACNFKRCKTFATVSALLTILSFNCSYSDIDKLLNGESLK